ncbi:MAG: hypothetical protein A2Y13_08550 [Planctomycetes bacterium GWC2_45_44]|nr:MAG: hypothetical protein A2Y13_08550 [Planctomycetes bacterium GWC2_45_44]
MKVQLVFVPPRIMPKYGELGEGISPPLGILSIASYLRKKLPGVEVKITDGLLIGYDNAVREVCDFKPDLLGLSFYTPVALSAYCFINEIREKFQNMLILTGGPHATALPEESLKLSRTDIVVMGEGEETVYEIVKMCLEEGNIKSMNLSNINGIAFLRDGKIQHTETREYIKNLDEIPFPARELVDMKNYRGWFLCKQTPETTMIFSRGCPYNCTFCSNIVWNISQPRVRLRSPQNIVDEMQHLHTQYGIKEFFDNSDEFNNNVEHAISICREIIRRGLKITWKTQLRAYPLNEELVELMAKSGCWYVHLGIESGNAETLKGIGKHVTLTQVVEACRLLKKYKIKVLGLFMLFNVWERDNELKYENIEMTDQTLDFARKLVADRLLDYIGWSITTPYPGSKLHDIVAKFGLIKENLLGNWDAWLKEDSFVLKLPGIFDKDMARMKTKGSFLRAKCMLRSGEFGLKDVGYIGKKCLKILQNEFKARFQRV